MKRIAVFCGSAFGTRPAYTQAAMAVGAAIAARGIGLVYGGGRVGLMGVVADAVMGQGGHAIGVIPTALYEKEVGHAGLTELRVVATMHERKAMMAELSDAFLALPGGFGTLEEFAEILTWAQLGLHRKPFGLLDVEGYYAPLLALFDHMVGEGFARASHRALVLSDNDPARFIDTLITTQPPHMDKWIERDDI
jgi:hypothetical protein